MIKSYWLRLCLFALGGALIALVASLMAPRKYEAVVAIMIDQKPLTASMTANNAEQSVSDMIDFSRPRTLTTQVQQLTSYGVVSDAARRVALQNNWADPSNDPTSPIFPGTLMDALAVEAEASSDIITMRIRLPDKQLAKSVAAEIYSAFVAQNLRNTTELASRAGQFMQTQFDDISKQLKSVDSATEKLRGDTNTPDLVLQIQSEISNLASLKAARDTTRLDLATVTERVSGLESGLKRLNKEEPGGRGTTINPARQRLKGEKAAAEAEIKGLLERYLPDRDEVKIMKAKLAVIEAALANEDEQVPGSEATIPNSILQNMLAQVEEGRANIRGLRDRMREVNQAISEKEATLKTYPAAQAKQSELNRQQLALERLYLAYADRLKTLKAAQSGRVTPTREVTPATALPDPVSPKPIINTLFGIVAGLILGVLSMLATEAKKQPIRSLAQLNQLAFRPVYRLVPELRAPFRGLSKAPPESYETLLANHLRSTNRPYRLAVVGLAKDSGASTTAVNLAVAGARHGSRVLLVECDPRGALARLAGKQPAANEVVEISPMIRGISTQTLLTLGGERNPEVNQAIQQHEADLTIIDLEPASKSAEYAFVAAHVDEVILLVRAGRTKSVEFLQAQQALKEAGCPQVTVAFTRSSDLAVVTESADPSMIEDQGRTPKSLDA